MYLLYQITKEIDGVIARIIDSDGEFLLIEAANYLPKWANPEVCTDRTYIYQGALHIIPLNREASIQQIRKHPKLTCASDDIQNSILNRIKGYPQSITDGLHSATLYLPIGVASILKYKPNLVSSAVQAFCNRDIVDMKVCRAMKYFPPENRVYTKVKFTKCLYAMLIHSRYVPDKRIGWNVPLINSPQYKSHNLGVKLASGFEILASQAKPSQVIENDKGWHTYLKSLKNRNYFDNLIDNSQEYNTRLSKAKEYYLEHRDSAHSVPLIGQEILDLLKNLEHNAEDFKNNQNCLLEDEDDSWLNIDPKELDKMLEERYGQKKVLSVNDNASATTFTKKISEFLDHVSEVDGVEFPNNSPIRPQRGIKCKGKNKVSFTNDTKLEEKPSSNKVNFDPAAFTCALQNILDFMIPEDDNWDLDSDSDMSAYGEDQEIDIENCNKSKNKMQEYMDQMDKELANTTIGESFYKVNKSETSFDDIETFKPVDIDMNALKNILESYQAEMGESGPASNMLGPMGVHLEPGTSQNKL